MAWKIMDNFGRLWKKEAKPSPKDHATIQPHERTSFYPSVHLTPEKLANIFQAADIGDVQAQSELFEEMEEKDGHLNGELVKRKNAVARELEWNILPASEDKVDIERAQWCKAIFDKIPEMDQNFFDLLDAIGKGYSGLDIYWGLDGQYHIPRRLKYIQADRLTFINSVDYPQWINGVGSPEDIPAWRIIYHRHKAKSGYDTRAGVIRVCSWMYLFKNYSVKDWVSFCDIYGIPFRLGKYQPGSGEQHEIEKKDLLAAVRALGSDGAGIISAQTEVEFLSAANQAGKDNLYQVLCEFCNKEMSKAIIGNALSTENYSMGARASSETGNNVRKDLIKGDAWGLSETINNQLIRPLIGFNFGWDVQAPIFKFELEEPEDLLQISQIYKNLVEMGQPISREHVSHRFSVPLPKKGENLLGAGIQKETQKLILKAPVKPDVFSQEGIDLLADEGANKAQDVLKPVIEQIISKIKTADTLEDIGSMIYSLFPGINMNEFEKMLSVSMFASAGLGYGEQQREIKNII